MGTDRESWSLNNPDFIGWNFSESVMYRAQLVWDTGSLSWVKMTQPGGGGGGGGPVTVADGVDVTQGALADAAVLGDSSGTISAKLRGINKEVAATVGLGIAQFDYASQSQSATQDVWSFRSGGAGGTLVNTVTINYVDSTKLVITDVTKS